MIKKKQISSTHYRDMLAQDVFNPYESFHSLAFLLLFQIWWQNWVRWAQHMEMKTVLWMGLAILELSQKHAV